MGIIIAKVFKKEKEPDAPEFIAPTPAQIQMIKDTWEIPKKNLTDTGEVILFRFLDEFPKNQEMFDALRNVPLLSLKGTPGFRTHAIRIMTLFQGAIDCFDTADVVENLHKNFAVMADSHAKRQTRKVSFFELRGILLDVLTEACGLNEEQREAWTIFYNCAMNIIFGKFDEYHSGVRIYKEPVPLH